MNSTAHFERDSAAKRMQGIAFALVILVFIYLCTAFVPIGWLTYILSLPALGVLGITALARINDIQAHQVSSFWNVRRMGLALVGMFAVANVVAPLALGPTVFPTWRMLIGEWGFAMTWLTTPNLPPWKDYIWKSMHLPPVVGQQRRTTDHPPT